MACRVSIWLLYLCVEPGGGRGRTESDNKCSFYLLFLQWEALWWQLGVQTTPRKPHTPLPLSEHAFIIQLLNCVLTLCDPMDCSTPGFPLLHHIPKFTQTHVHWVGDAFQTSHPLFPPSLAFNLPSNGVFPSESALCIRWPKYWHFSFSTSPSNEYSGLISFRIDKLDLLAVQRTLKSLLQHHSLKPSILQSSAFFMRQLTSVHE